MSKRSPTAKNPLGKSPRSPLGKSPRSVAYQVFVLQVVVVVLLVLGAILALVLESRHASDAEARNRSVAVAETFAHSPGLLEALKSPSPTTVLQPLTEETRRRRRCGFRRGDGHPWNPVHAPLARPDRQAVRRNDRSLAGLPGLHRERARPARPRSPGGRARQGPRRIGRGPGVGRAQGQERRLGGQPAAARHPRHRCGRTRGGHDRDRSGRQAAEAPDARPRPGRDDPHVRAPQRRPARRPGGRGHRRAGQAVAPRERRGEGAARAPGRRGGPVSGRAAGPRPRHRGAAAVGQGGHGRGAPGDRPVARGEPAADRPARRFDGNGRDHP